ncbi:histone deacetylase family protein [Coralloluteibacterium thermophilus]|uniref:Histone deacetylase family protein n=1 Tax=Coralloluteibacterium thermophilum TaxID=2707049 RepID=A0ABV9NSZ3_9GAMM
MSLPVYTHPACLQHSPGRGHPECPERLGAVIDSLRGAVRDLDWREAPQALRSQLARVHAPELIAEILDVPTVGARRLDSDTVMNAHSAEAALRAAGAGVAAVDGALRGREPRAFCAVRPPGHHATADIAMGFCLFNSVAVAAAHAVEAHGLERVAVVDFDVHHGNGTQAIFERDPRVFYLSSHQAALYPDTGFRHERGVGNLVNVPLAAGTDGAGFRKAWTEILLPALDDARPQLILVSAGFDAHRLDPLADLDIDVEDYHWLTRELVALAERHAQGRIVSSLEGGYSLSALRASAVAHVRALMDA